jgi:gamma-glutamyltranspeptidase/glutathione hydrolase
VLSDRRSSWSTRRSIGEPSIKVELSAAAGMNRGPSMADWRIASGHVETTLTAARILEAGGNAADAAVAAALSATVAEPLLCSLGGGIHALVKRDGSAPLALDAFTQTPRKRRIDTLDFYPITGNFGTDVQEFHVGMAAIATPGALAGLLALNGRFGRMPMSEIVQPAIELARRGVEVNAVQAYALRILEPIVRASDETARVFGLSDRNGRLPGRGSRVGNAALAHYLDHLGRHGDDSFYRGELARTLAADSVYGGGHLTLEDLSGYRPRWRRPLRWRYRDATVWSTPPPAFGGMMLALASSSLARDLDPTTRPDSPQHLAALCRAMAESEDLRQHLEQPELFGSARGLRQAFARLPPDSPGSRRGTTHISIDDGRGQAVAITLSNGEGNGYVLPGTGIVLNNMLGEEDINRCGFHGWPLNRRLASMMAPSIVQRRGQRWLLGSGGSNRIRTTLAQVISRLIDFKQPLERAIAAPRLHLERGRLALENPVGAWPEESLEWLSAHYPDARRWPQRNLYFGGVHAVSTTTAAADPRREGFALTRTTWR